MLGVVILLGQHDLFAGVQAGMDDQRREQVACHLSVIFRHGHDDTYVIRLIFAQTDGAPVLCRQRHCVVWYKRDGIGDDER